LRRPILGIALGRALGVVGGGGIIALIERIEKLNAALVVAMVRRA